tara:strand:+ start:1835 stop:2848 length:1014 start_codon:yes stop_codon:yes gene_type:complete
MSEETGRISEEDKFLGVKTTIDVTPGATEEEGTAGIDIEVIDDRSEEDQRYAPLDQVDQGDQGDKELKRYGGKVQDRIGKLKKDYHDERRAKEQAERMSQEAVSYTQAVQVENQRLVKLVQDSQTALTSQAKSRASANMALAEDNFKKAHESGDSSEIAEAQKHLTNAQLAQAYAPNVSQKIIDNWKGEVLAQQRAAAQQQPYVPEQQPVEPDAKAVEWQEHNKWFGEDTEMTSFAYGVHERLVNEEGIDPDSKEYYDSIDQRMKQVFPTQFGRGDKQTFVVDTATPRKTSPVAGASRNSGTAPRQVTLTRTQVKLAERLGLTPKQYAAQLIKERTA